MMGGASSRRGLWLDPRTKILLLLFCILSAMMAPSLFYELGLVVLIGLLGVCFGKWKYAWKGVLFYALIVLLTLWIMDTMTGTWRTMFMDVVTNNPMYDGKILGNKFLLLFC